MLILARRLTNDARKCLSRLRWGDYLDRLLSKPRNTRWRTIKRYGLTLVGLFALVLGIGSLPILIIYFWGGSTEATSANKGDQSAQQFTEQEVRFKNGEVTLVGTLRVPSTKRQHPAIVFIHGSGPQDRDFGPLASMFARRGIAVLTYDKRGVGDSTGDFTRVPFYELAGDALAGVQLLKTRKEINPDKIGVWGVSQGGWLGPLAASQSADIAFVISVSGPAVSPKEQMLFYRANQLRDRGLTNEAVEEATRLRRLMWDYLCTGERQQEVGAELERAKKKPWFPELASQGFPPTLPNVAAMSESELRWYRQEMNYDPVAVLEKISVPVLEIFGEEDELVPVDKSLEILKQTFERSGNKDVTVKVFPGADHGIQIFSRRGERQFAPGYVEMMIGWLEKRLVLKAINTSRAYFIASNLKKNSPALIPDSGKP
jgi:pimeloyl-ACP methyl ester carboxylesterase